MKIQVYKFTSLSPLLMSSIESVNRNLPQLKLGTQPNAGDIEKIAEGMTYRNADGSLYMPTQALRSSLLAGCAGQKMPGTRIGPKKMFQSLIFATEEKAALLDEKGKPITKWEVQVDSGVNRANKARIIVVRPRIDSWSAIVPFEIDDEYAPSNFDQFMTNLMLIWNRAGRSAGIGAWRPECSGRFGRYMVEQV